MKKKKKSLDPYKAGMGSISLTDSSLNTSRTFLAGAMPLSEEELLAKAMVFDDQSVQILNWYELPHDLLVEIAERIEKLEDFVSFGAVCKAWHVARKRKCFKGLRLWQGIPYLMHPVRDEVNDVLEFYSLVDGETVASVSIPKFKDRMCFESLGWLFAVGKDGSIYLLDPFSTVEIPVPHQSTIQGYGWHTRRNETFVQKFVLSARPSETSDFIVMIICGYDGNLAFWRPGRKSWNQNKILTCCTDIMYHDGHFYATSSKGYVWVFTFEGHNPPVSRMVIRFEGYVDNNYIHIRNTSSKSYKLYILKTSQSLFMITRVISRYAYMSYYKTCKFQVRHVDMSISAGTWVEINNIGSMAIFVGHNVTFAVDTSRFFGKIKGNHIYFTDDDWNYSYDSRRGSEDMGAYNMATRTVESFYSEEVLLNEACPSIWITPSF